MAVKGSSVTTHKRSQRKFKEVIGYILGDS